LTILTLQAPSDLKEAINTPADDHWTLTISYGFINETINRFIEVIFLPTGEVDLIHTRNTDYATANTLLAPTISLLRSNQIDLWRLVNWLFVSIYWTTLNDFGLISPTPYVLPSSGFGNADFSHPIPFPSTNNIFVNATLFDIYSSYLRDIILPFIGFPDPEFAPVDEVNRLQQTGATFLRSYTCTIRQLKNKVGLIFSVWAVVYALVGGGYKVVMLIVGTFLKREEDSKSPVLTKLICR
jgi:hypothetical protein